MKATDQEILHAIWRMTITMVARRSLTHYIGKKYSIPSGDFDNEGYATYLATPEKRHLGINLGDCQLLKRLRKLGGISWDRPEIYRIDSPHRKSMYYRALDLFRERGVKEEPTPMTDIKINNIKNEVEKILMDEMLNLFPKANGESP